MNLSSQRAVFGWRPACWLRVSGADATAFLQGQFTNDLRSLAPGKCVYGLWLNVKGKIVADSFVVAGSGEERWIGSYFSTAAAIKERLESFIIADDVTVEDQTDQWAAVTAFGADAETWAAERRQQLGGTGFVFRGRRDRTAHVEWAFPAEAAPRVREVLGDEIELGSVEVLRRRIEACIPAIPADLGPGDLPNEGGLEDEAISYTKGCYLGQEVMARLKSMGQVRRRLVRVSGKPETLPTLPAPVFVGDRQVGELRSAVPSDNGGIVGLAMVSRLHAQASTPLAFAADRAPVLGLLDTP